MSDNSVNNIFTEESTVEKFEKRRLPIVEFPKVEGDSASVVYIIPQVNLSEIRHYSQHTFWNLQDNGKLKNVTFPCLKPLGVECPGCLIHANEKEENPGSKTQYGPKDVQVWQVLQVERVEKGKPAGVIEPKVFFMKETLKKDFQAAESSFGTLVGRLFSVTKTGKGTATRYSQTHFGESGLDLTSFEVCGLHEAIALFQRFTDPVEMANYTASMLYRQFSDILDGHGYTITLPEE